MNKKLNVLVGKKFTANGYELVHLDKLFRYHLVSLSKKFFFDVLRIFHSGYFSTKCDWFERQSPPSRYRNNFSQMDRQTNFWRELNIAKTHLLRSLVINCLANGIQCGAWYKFLHFKFRNVSWYYNFYHHQKYILGWLKARSSELCINIFSWKIQIK